MNKPRAFAITAEWEGGRDIFLCVHEDKIQAEKNLRDTLTSSGAGDTIRITADVEVPSVISLRSLCKLI